MRVSRIAGRASGDRATRHSAIEPTRETTTMTDQAKQTITITMSERRPLRIDPEIWPVIARAKWHDGQYDFQANTVRLIKVREHSDGRRIVYGLQKAGGGGQYVGTRNPEGGFLVSLSDQREDETVRAIRRVAGIVGDDGLGDECIADLPPEDASVAVKPITMPRDGAQRWLQALDETIAEAGHFIDPRYAARIREIANELRTVLGK